MLTTKLLPRFLRSRAARHDAQARRELENSRLLTARLLISQMQQRGVLSRLADAEFRVFSQFGDDGIIQYLIHHVKPRSEVFIEFGVENYTEANTRFLLLNSNWRGLIMDGSESAMASVRREALYWRHDLTAVAAFINRDNINDLFAENGFSGEIGLLSVDIDGNDYWVWDRINCVDPAIVVSEYNSVFGARRAVTIPYDANFVRTKAHHSNLYWGCSLRALCHLANRKGYAFVGCNSNGNNAYFVRRASLGPLRELSPEEGYVESRFRESRDAAGQLTFVGGSQRREIIAKLPVLDIDTNEMIEVGSL